VIAGTEPFSRKVIDAAKKLKVISRVGVGTDNIDLQAVKARQITVMTTPDSPSQAVAEHTIALLLDVLKRVSLYNSALRQEDYSTHAARLLMGQRCGIIGMGRIGKKVAHLLLAFGCDVSYFDPGVSIQSDRGIKKSNTINELVQTSEIITLHASGRSDNKPIITKSIIQNAKNDLVIINTARGSLIDEKALIWGLRNKKVVGAGLDVFPKEPYHGPLLSFS
jgi:D-3-phosphoglycerate dehydrogenase